MKRPLNINRKHGFMLVALLALLLTTSFASIGATSAAECTWTHLVRPGDTLSSIAQYYGVTVGDILRLNSQITDRNLIKWGTTICVSDSASAPPLLPGNYVVKPGDTLAYIAWRFGATLIELARANGIGNPNLIYAGDTVTVPTPEVAAPEPTVEPTPEATAEVFEVTPEATVEAVG